MDESAPSRQTSPAPSCESKSSTLRPLSDGREIFYINPKGILTAVPVSAEGTFSAGAPSPLFAIRGRAPISSTDLFTYDIAKDGKRFLVNRYVKPDHVQPLTVVLNAAAGMKK